MVQTVLSDAGWARSSVDKIAASQGPGAFTAIRIGLALTAGLSVGLKRPSVGVCSLRALAASAFVSNGRLQASGDGVLRIAVRDARRNEYFAACFDSTFHELVGPLTIPVESAAVELFRLAGGQSAVFIGAPSVELGLPQPESGAFRGADPHAAAVALLGEGLAAEEAPAVPRYVRGPNVVRPNLPRSPLELDLEP